jgi:uridine kinase
MLHMQTNFIVGIGGGSGSGKTSLATKLASLYPTQVQIINLDNYYKPKHLLAKLNGSNAINYDHPDNLNYDSLCEQLTLLKQGQYVFQPKVSFYGEASPMLTLQPKPIVLVEGIFCLVKAQLRNFLDYKIFIEVNAQIRLARRLVRDIDERQISYQAGLEQFKSMTQPGHLQYIEPSKKFAQEILTYNYMHNNELGSLIELITSKLNIKS